MLNKPFSLLAILVLIGCFQGMSQHPFELDHHHTQNCCDGLKALDEDQFTFVPPPANFDPNADRSVVISVNYNGFTTEAMIAFDYAVNIWATNLVSNVPIIINASMANLGAGILGSAGPVNIFRNFSGAPQTNTWYPVALANKLAGFDLAGTTADISCQFSSTFSWYYGTDGITPAGQYDFVSVVLHELGHGLGFIGSANVSGSTGSLGQAGSFYIYDTFVELSAGTSITTLPNNSTTLKNALTGNQLYWNGAQGMIGNGGTRPRLYAPTTWNGGSSFSHLNESTYPSGNPNSLMTPFIGSAEAIHSPGDVTYGIFVDMGWEIGNCSITNIVATNQTTCDPATNTYSQTVEITYDLPPSSGLLSVNGQLYPFITNPATIVLTNLPSDGQPVSVSAFFTADPACSFFATNLFTAPISCCEKPRITQADTNTKEITLHNYGTCDVDLTNCELCASFFCEPLGTMTLISGSLLLSPGQDVVVGWNTWAPSTNGSDLSLYLPNPTYSNPDHMYDFTQWGGPGNGQESVAVAKGIWTQSAYIMGYPPYFYTGNGFEDGLAFWQSSPPPCSIDFALPLTQSACDPATNTYSQDVAIQYSNQPTTGSLVVNGQLFSIPPPPALVTLAGLTSDGNPVDVTIGFTDNNSCDTFFPALFTAPAACNIPCSTDLNGDFTTDVQDLLIFLADYGCMGTCVGDFNGDGTTDSADILLFLPSFGQACQ